MAAERGLVVRDLTKSYGARRVVDHVNLRVAPGEVVGLLGPNGAGKSTTFLMVAGLVRPDEGCVLLDGTDVSALPLHRRAERGLGYLGQEPSVFRRLTVEENLLAVLELRSGLKASLQRARAQELLEEFELRDLANQRADRLSGGERRRLEIARCLAVEPTTILFDEPFAGIDPLAVAELQALVGRLQERGLAILLTDHNVREALGVCHRAYVIVEGRVIVEGGRDDIAASEVARAHYLGPRFLPV